MDIYISKIRPTTLVLLPTLLGDVDLLLNNPQKKKSKTKKTRGVSHYGLALYL
jgi:hypothetical protein